MVCAACSRHFFSSSKHDTILEITSGGTGVGGASGSSTPSMASANCSVFFSSLTIVSPAGEGGSPTGPSPAEGGGSPTGPSPAGGGGSPTGPSPAGEGGSPTGPSPAGGGGSPTGPSSAGGRGGSTISSSAGGGGNPTGPSSAGGGGSPTGPSSMASSSPTLGLFGLPPSAASPNPNSSSSKPLASSSPAMFQKSSGRALADLTGVQATTLSGRSESSTFLYAYCMLI